MKVLLVGNYAPHRQKSMQRFADVLERGLSAQGHQVRVVRPPIVLGEMGLPWPYSKWPGYVDMFILFPRVLKKAAEWADVVHFCDHAYSPFVKYVRHKPHVVTCHDVLAIRSALGEIPCNPTAWSGKQLQRMIVNGLKLAAHVVCVSETTRSELERVVGVHPAVTTTIYNGLNFPYYPVPDEESQPFLEQFGIAGTRFIFHVGNNSWYKNRPGVLRIFEALHAHPQASGVKLVMAGQPWTKEMTNFVADRGLSSSVVELVDPSNEALRSLYCRAELLLFPSLQEGFGWPIIEAQACGCPVVTSDRMPMQEIGTDAAAYIDPEDPAGAVDTLLAVLARRDRPCRTAIENASRFNTASMMEQYSDLYAQLVNGSETGTEQNRPPHSETQPVHGRAEL